LPLDARSVVDLLLERGALEPEDVLDRSLSVSDVSRRNLCFAVRRDGAPGLFVKHPRTEDPLSLASLHNESRVIGLAAPAPGVRLYDPQRHVLVVDLIPDGEELFFRTLREHGLRPELARALGAAVGTMHRTALQSASEPPPSAGAWILGLATIGDAQLPRDAPGVAHLRDLARDDPQLADGLAALRETWTADVLVHGDLKWENVLVSGTEPPRVHLVDWEEGGVGDPAWDVGGMLHTYLRDWVIARETPNMDDGDLLRAMPPSAAALWDGYRTTARPEDPAALLMRSIGMAGARLLQTAYEDVAGRAGLTDRAVALSQLAANVLARPRDALTVFFDLAPDAAA
jgi:hypothetical protein